MSHLRLPFLFVFSALLVCVLSEYNLTIVHINDFHSHWFEFNEYEKSCTEDESKAGKCFGGFPRLLTMVRDLRKKEKNVLVLSSGEFFYGRSHNALHGWKLANALLPLLKLDAMSLANHDFGRGILELSAFLYKMEFPVLCANMLARNSSFLYSRVNKSVVLNVNGEKIGIVGYINPDALEKSRFAVSVKFYPEIPAVKSEVEELEEKGINKIIALGHSGYFTDMEIAKQVKGVDVVIGGNSDIVFEKPGKENSEAPTDGNIYENYPRLHHHDVEPGSERINKTLVLHIPQHGKYVGVVRVTFNESGNIIHESGEPLLLDNSIPQDQETLLFLKNASITLEAIAEDYRIPDRSEILAVAESDFDGRLRSCRMRECSLGNLVVDAIFHMYDEYKNQESWGSIDAVVINSGLIRYSIQAGNITLRDIFHALFTGDLIQRTYMPGTELKLMMEHAVKNYDPTGITASGAFLQVSGLKVEYDLSKPAGNRVKSLLIRTKTLEAEYKPVKPYKTYYVVMPSFMRNGNDGFRNFDLADDSQIGQADFMILIDYLKELKTVRPKIDGRISFYMENKEIPLTSTIKDTFSGTVTQGSTTTVIKSDHVEEKRLDKDTKSNYYQTSTMEKDKLNEVSINRNPHLRHEKTENTSPIFRSFESKPNSSKPNIEETIVNRKDSMLMANETKNKFLDHTVQNESYSSKSNVNSVGNSFRLSNESSELKYSALNLTHTNSDNNHPHSSFLKEMNFPDSYSEVPVNKYIVSSSSESKKGELETSPKITTGEDSTSSGEFKPSMIFQIANSSLGDLERILLEAVISETKLSPTILSETAIDVLGDSLKSNLKKFLKARTQIVTSSSIEELMAESKEVFNLSSSSKFSNSQPTESSRKKDYLSLLSFYAERTEGYFTEHAPQDEKKSYRPTDKAKASTTESDPNHKDVETVQDLLVHSIVDSILEKVKRKLLGEEKHNNAFSTESPFVTREAYQNNDEVTSSTEEVTAVVRRILFRTLDGTDGKSSGVVNTRETKEIGGNTTSNWPMLFQ